MIVAGWSVKFWHRGGRRGIPRIEPMSDEGWTPVSRTFQQVAPSLVATNFHLPAGEQAIAHDTGALIVEGVPFSLHIRGPKNFQPLFRSELSLHVYLRSKVKRNLFDKDNRCERLLLGKKISHRDCGRTAIGGLARVPVRPGQILHSSLR